MQTDENGARPEAANIDYLNELRDMARQGNVVALLGSGLYLLWGCTMALAAVLHLLVLGKALDGGWLLWIWGGAIAVSTAGTFAILGRIDDDKRASADRNRSSGFGWAVGGAACILFFMSNWMVQSAAIALTPAIAGFVFAAVMAFSAVISRQNWLRYCAIGWLAFGTVYIILPDPILQTAALSVAATLLLIIPGLYLRRQEGRSAR